MVRRVYHLDRGYERLEEKLSGVGLRHRAGERRLMAGLLLLRAEDADDLAPVSACVQDMVVKAGEVGWWPGQRRLLILGNRFRWRRVQGGEPPTWVCAALRFEHVTHVARREWPDEAHAVLPLLAITAQGPTTS